MEAQNDDRGEQTAEVELSIVSPVYEGEGSLDVLYARLVKAATAVTDRYEIILVEDGSPDRSWEEICVLAGRDHRVRGIRLARNFGQQRALAAGLAVACGERIVVIDCDLQDPPEAIVDMWQMMDLGVDIVYTRRSRRQDSLGKRFSSWLFFKAMYWFSDVCLPPGISSFSMIGSNVRDAYLSVADKRTLYVAGLYRIGFASNTLDVPHSSRASGRSGYTFAKRLRVAIDAMILSGMIGLHMSRIFERGKDEPLYLVREEVNLGEQKRS